MFFLFSNLHAIGRRRLMSRLYVIRTGNACCEKILKYHVGPVSIPRLLFDKPIGRLSEASPAKRASRVTPIAPAGEAARGEGFKGPPLFRHPVEWRQANILFARWAGRGATPSL